jgi:hypothetical protein
LRTSVQAAEDRAAIEAVGPVVAPTAERMELEFTERKLDLKRKADDWELQVAERRIELVERQMTLEQRQIEQQMQQMTTRAVVSRCVAKTTRAPQIANSMKMRRRRSTSVKRGAALFPGLLRLCTSSIATLLARTWRERGRLPRRSPRRQASSMLRERGRLPRRSPRRQASSMLREREAAFLGESCVLPHLPVK